MLLLLNSFKDNTNCPIVFLHVMDIETHLYLYFVYSPHLLMVC